MFSVPDGRAANQLSLVVTFRPPILAWLPGASVSLAVMVLAGQLGGLGRVAGELGELGLLFQRGRGVDALVPALAEAGHLILMQLRGVLAGLGGDLGGQQVGDQTILVGGPHAAVAAQEAHAGALLAAERDLAAEQRIHEPLEATGTSTSFALMDEATRSIREEETRVCRCRCLPASPDRLPPNRYSTHTAM